MQIGMIGLGRMGANMVRRLMRGGHDCVVFDRSAELPTGGFIEQADGTSWMAMFCLDMLTIALELALHDAVYEELACKFFEHFIFIAVAMDRIGLHNDELWDEEDGFFYDVLCLPDGGSSRPSCRARCRCAPSSRRTRRSPDRRRRAPRSGPA